MKEYSAFFLDVLPELPGISPDMAIRAIRNTVIEFCEKSLIHQVTQDPVTLIPNIDTYDLDAPTGYRVHKVMKVWFKGVELEPLAPDDIIKPDSYMEVPSAAGYTASKGPVTGYLQKDFDTLTFTPIPDQQYPNAITMRVALVPLRDSTGCEDFLFEQWGEVISCGAKSRLMLNPGKPYSNPNTAAINQARYASGINEARQRATRGNVRSTLQVQMRSA